MRILVLCTELTRFFGAEKVAATLARALLEQYGHEVHLAYLWGDTRDTPPVRHRLEQAGVRCSWLGKPYHTGFRYLRRSIQNAQRIVRLHRPHIVHSHTFQLDVIASMLQGPMVRVRTLHNSRYHEHGWKKHLYIPFQRYWMAKRFAATIAVSPSLLTHWRQTHRAASLHLIPNPISERFYQGAQVRTQAPAPPYQIGVIGRLTHQKGQSDALSALQLLIQRGVHAQLQLAGEGEDKHLLQQQAQRLGVAHCVHFLGQLSEEKVAQLHHQLDVLWAPSRYEGFGLMVYEALAGGLPIIATPVVGLQDALSATNAPMVPPNNPKALADATQQLLQNPQTYSSVSKKGIHMADTYRLTRITEGHHRLFQALVS